MILRTALALAASCVMLLASSAEATPLKLDLEKIVDQAQRPVQRFAPARAGWGGPMMQTAHGASTPAFTQMLDEAALARAMRQQLAAIAIPDPRVLIGLATLILLLRKWREMRRPVATRVPQPA